MSVSHHEDHEQLEAVKSRLGQSLIRLHQNLEHNRQKETDVENLFSMWQQKWSSRREQISRRLEMIESQLEQLTEQAGEVPQFAVVGVPPDADEMISMGPF